MQLTNHFTLQELTRSSTAQRLGLDNTAPQEIVPRLILLAEMLERIRAAVRSPVIVTSGYR
jgi:zinc D-Ala-D-Ala carboxypeptidase